MPEYHSSSEDDAPQPAPSSDEPPSDTESTSSSASMNRRQRQKLKKQLLKASGESATATTPAAQSSAPAPAPAATPAASNPAPKKRERRKKGKVFLEDKSALLSLMDDVTDKKNAVITEKLAVEKQRAKDDKARNQTTTKKKANKKQEDKRKALVSICVHVWTDRCRTLRRPPSSSGIARRGGEGRESRRLRRSPWSRRRPSGLPSVVRFLGSLSLDTLKSHCMHHLISIPCLLTKRPSQPRLEAPARSHMLNRS